MKHFIILLLTAMVTLTIVFIVYRPDIVERVWLWVIGLAGPAIGWGNKIIKMGRARLELLGKNKINKII
jgi:hypothetical protein